MKNNLSERSINIIMSIFSGISFLVCLYFFTLFETWLGKVLSVLSFLILCWIFMKALDKFFHENKD
ncbi:hypothetical protein VQ7734_03260 [Vibrio quintilis]|uniref:Uncharacterized protein n=1 Tax=Vibrio quintilis TaxID=1117707 RepID=A0A1M7YXX1_9VIBR|nr:hypothetical protein VQ7734_03260 [Vibrio quintilis]